MKILTAAQDHVMDKFHRMIAKRAIIILEQVKKRIVYMWGHQYICYAIKDVTGMCYPSMIKHLPSIIVCKYLKYMIGRSLSPQMTIEAWLSMQGYSTYGLTNEQMLQYRLAWIDWMIEGWEAKLNK